MAQSYTRQSTFADGDTISASLFNNEYNQLVNSFAYSSSSAVNTGHRHDGTAGQGGNIPKIGDLDFLNKIEVDSTNNRWGFYVEVSSAAVEQIRIQDGAIVPVTDNDIDLGTSSLQFKDLFINGTANIDSLVLSSGSTVTAILDEDGLTSNSATSLATQQSIKAYVDAQVTAQDLDFSADSGGALSIDLDSESLTFTGGTGIDTSGSGNAVTFAIDSTVTTLTGSQTLTNKTLTSPDINGGTVDGATIATSDITVGAGKTLDVSAGTLTLADNQISGDKVEGGTINAVTVNTLTYGSLSDGSITITAFVDEDNMASDSAALVPTQQSVKAYVDSQVTAQDLDVTTDSGTIAIDLDSETLTVAGGTGLSSSATGNAVTIDIDSTVATLTGSQTLSNKTLATPVVSGNLTTDGLIDGRDVATDGTKLDGIESGATADQTAAEIKTAYESNADTNAFTDADHSKLDGIEASADVTDTANVTAAGALMDSELTSEASVKALNQGVATTDSPSFAGLTVDTSTLKVDSTNNRVGIGNASPDVSLDLGSNTDSIHVPVGTTAQRPGSPAAGYFRYNTSLAQFEGYTDAWGAIGGGGTNTFTTDSFTGNGSTTAYALSQAVASEDNLLVFIEGVFQQQNAYSIATSGGVTTLTFSTAPANGNSILVYSVAAGVSGSNLNIDSMTGDGSDTTLTLTINPVNENNTQVFIDGVYQNKSTYSISGTTLTFSTAPPSGSAVEVMTMTQTDINVPVDNSITSAKLSGDLTLPGNLSFADNAKAIFGAGSDLEILSNGTDGLIRNGNATGEIRMESDDRIIISDRGFNEVFAVFNDDDDVKLYHNGNQKLATTSTGIDITGSVVSDGLTSSGPINLTAGALAAAGNAGLSHRSSDNKVYLQAGTGGFNILDDQQNTHFAIDSAGVSSFYGKVGIGGSTITDSNLLNLQGSGISVNVGVVFNDTNTSKIFGIQNGGSALKFFDYTASAERMRIDSSGNVGIGTSSITTFSGYKTLHFKNESGNAISLAESDGGIIAQTICDDATGVTIGSRSNHILRITTNDAERMRLDSSGRVSFGPDAADIQIDPASTNSGNNLIYMRGNASNDKSSIQLNHYGVADYHIGVGHVGSGKFNIANDQTGNDFVIDTTGKVGIGVSGPDVKMDIVETPATIVSGNAINGSTMKGLKIRTNLNSDESVGIWFGTNGSHWSGISGQRKNSSTTWGTNLSFYTHENATNDLTYARERMTIDSEGNVGIGTSSVTGNLQILTATAGSVLNVNHNTGGSYPKASGIGLGATSTALTVSSDGSTVSFTGGAGLYAENTAASGNPTNLVFWTNLAGTPAEAIRITSTGCTGFFGAGSNTRSDITLTTRTSDNTKRWGFGGGATGNNAVFYVINEGNVGVYLAHGGQAWIAHSDARIKENIVDVGTVLPSLMNMRCVKYNLISNPGDTKIGFIAQDWESAFPEVVDENEHLVLEDDGTIGTDDNSDSTTPVKAMAYTETIPLLLKAIQEQQAMIETLQARITQLENN